MRNQSSPQLDYTLTQAVKRLIKVAPVFVAADASVGDAAREMQRARIGSVLVATEPPGIVTDRDLRGRVLATNLGPETPVTKVMTRPLKTIDSDMLAFSALRLMVDENIHHLPVVEDGKIVGIISSTDLLFHQTNNPVYLRRIIDHLDEATAATGSYTAAIAALADTLFQGGLGALQIAQIVSSLNDALVKRLVQLAEKTVGYRRVHMLGSSSARKGGWSRHCSPTRTTRWFLMKPWKKEAERTLTRYRNGSSMD
jgi:CBS domain-containing protein